MGELLSRSSPTPLQELSQQNRDHSNGDAFSPFFVWCQKRRGLLSVVQVLPSAARHRRDPIRTPETVTSRWQKGRAKILFYRSFCLFLFSRKKETRRLRRLSPSVGLFLHGQKAAFFQLSVDGGWVVCVMTDNTLRFMIRVARFIRMARIMPQAIHEHLCSIDLLRTAIT